jgi:hypothetical protein
LHKLGPGALSSTRCSADLGREGKLTSVSLALEHYLAASVGPFSL